MTTESEFEQGVALIGEHAVTFRLEDGTTADVPRDVVQNSSLLHAALSDATVGDTKDLCVPVGMLQDWLQCVGEEPALLRQLKVADFMGDDSLVKVLSAKVGVWLFQGSPERLPQRAQVVATLPMNLLISILRGSKPQDEEVLDVCLEKMGAATVHALFPSIAETGILELGYMHISRNAVPLLWPHLCTISELVELDLTMSEGCSELLIHLPGMAGLTGLTLNEESASSLMPGLVGLPSLRALNVAVGPEGMQAVAQGIPRLRLLDHLVVSSCYFYGAPLESNVLQLVSNLAHLAVLRHLSLSTLGINEAVATDLAKQLTQMTMLSFLNLSGNPLGDAGIRVLCPSLTKLPTLRDLNLAKVASPVLRKHTLTKPGRHLAKCPSLKALDLGYDQLRIFFERLRGAPLSHYNTLCAMRDLERQYTTDTGTDSD